MVRKRVFLPPHLANVRIIAANQMTQQMGQMAPQAQMFGPGVDPDKQFLAEAENLAVIEHYSVLDDVEQRLLGAIAV
jgi:ER membrane protein complex subunit 3